MGRSIPRSHPSAPHLLPHGWGGAQCGCLGGCPAGGGGAPSGSERTPRAQTKGVCPILPARRVGTGLAPSWGPAEPKPVPRARGDAGVGSWGRRGAALGGAGGVGRCVPRVPQRADTRVHTQRGGIPTPRACPLLHLEPHQECGDLTRAGGTVPAPGPQAPRPPCCCLGGGLGCSQRDGDPAGCLGTPRTMGSGTAWGAGGRRHEHPCRLPSTVPALCRGRHPPKHRDREEENKPRGRVVPQETPAQRG